MDRLGRILAGAIKVVLFLALALLIAQCQDMIPGGIPGMRRLPWNS